MEAKAEKQSTLCLSTTPRCMREFCRSRSKLGSRIMKANYHICFLFFCFHVRSPSPHRSFVKLAFKSTRFSLRHPTIHRELPLRAEKLISIPTTTYQFFFLPAPLMLWSRSHIAMHPWVKCPSDAKTRPWGTHAFIIAPAKAKWFRLLFFSSQMRNEVQVDINLPVPCFSPWCISCLTVTA